MSSTPPILEEYGDSAVMVTVDSPDAGFRRRRIVQLRDAFCGHRPHGVTDVVSGLESFLIAYDPLITGPEHLAPVLRLVDRVATEPEAARGRVLDVPIIFGGDAGPDLAAVSLELGLSEQQVVSALVGHELTIVLLAAAMAPMMSGVTLPRPVARQAQPRTNVPAGSVMIAGDNAIIQPFPGPTGWRVVGWTPLGIVDITADPPIRFAAGDRLRLRAIGTVEAANSAGILLGEASRA